MKPLAEMPPAAAEGLLGVFTDIDDTITTDGRMPAAAYAALERLHDAGLAVVPVTGRPAGWCDMVARLWPVAGVVGENGAFTFRYDRGRAKDGPALHGVRCGARRQPRALVGSVRAHPGRGAGFGDRVRPGLSRGRSGDRFLRGCAGAAHGGRRPHRGALRVRGRAREDLVHPCQRLVRDLRQAVDDASLRARRVRSRPRFRARPLRVLRRQPQRRPDVRLLSHGLWGRQRARFRRPDDRTSRYVAPSRGGEGFVEIAKRLVEGRTGTGAVSPKPRLV